MTSIYYLHLLLSPTQCQSFHIHVIKSNKRLCKTQVRQCNTSSYFSATSLTRIHFFYHRTALKYGVPFSCVDCAREIDELASLIGRRNIKELCQNSLLTVFYLFSSSPQLNPDTLLCRSFWISIHKYVRGHRNFIFLL